MGGPSKLEAETQLGGRLALAAVGAVADVDADQLVAAAAGPEVIGAAQERRRGGGQRQDCRNRLHLLAGLPVPVDTTRLRSGNGLPAGGGSAKPVSLWASHRRED
jgi:hypothetical protein